MREIDFQHDLLPLKNKLFRLSLRITMQHAEAEDVVQDTLLKLWERRQDLNNINSLEAYALITCRNIALDRIALKEKQNISLDDSNADRPADEPTMQERLEKEESLSKLRRLIDKLPEQQRSVLQLRDIEGLSTRKTAEIMHMTEEAVKVNLFRARQMLKQKYLEIN